jgi:hypothetical protein
MTDTEGTVDLAACATAFRNAGVRSKELAALFGRSRVTATHWLSGRVTPYRDILPLYVAVAERAEKAYRSGVLPLQGCPPEKRLPTLKALLLQAYHAPYAQT